MKHNKLNISVVAALCVFCTAGFDAFGAGSVRALGGTGTYNGTAAAANANTSSTAARATTATRAGSLRVSPTATRSVSTATRTTPAGSTETTQRLSVGKYLGPATSVSTSGGSGSSTPGATAADIAEINNNITQIITNADALADRVDAVELAKQNVLSGDEDGIVEIEDDTVQLNLTNLATALEGHGWAMGHHIELRYDGDAHLEWRYTDVPGTTWKTLMNLDELANDYVNAGDLADAISALADTYATKAELNALSETVALKADADSVYTKSQIDAALENVATDEVVAGKQPKSTADYALGTAAGDWAPLSAAQQSALNSGIDATAVGQIGTNTTDIATINSAISDLSAIRSNATAGKNASDALGSGFDSTNTVAATIANLSERVDDLPTDANLAATNTRVSALETAVGDENSGLTAGVAANAADIAELRSDVDAIEIPTVPTVVSAFENDAGYLTEHQSLADYATTESVNTALAGKADTLTAAQLAAVNSGVTSDTVAAVGTNTTKITELQDVVTTNATNLANALSGKQNSLSTQQLAAVDSGITADRVATYDAYATAIDAKANASDLVRSDWNEEDSTKLSYIQNKPTIPAGVIVDSELSATSTNAIQNSVVKSALDERVPLGFKPTTGQYVLGFVDGVQTYIPIVDGNGDSGPAIAAATGDEI